MDICFNVYPKVLNGFDGIYTSANRMQDGFAWSQVPGATFDPDGWPDFLPPGATIKREFGRIPGGLGEPYTGHYQFRAEGTGRISFWWKERTPSGWPTTALLKPTDYRPGDVIDIDVPKRAYPGLIEFRLHATDLDGDGEHLRRGDFRHMSIPQGRRFAPAFAALHGRCRAFRPMEAAWRKEALPQWEGPWQDRTADHYCWGGDGKLKGDRLHGVPDAAALEFAAIHGNIPQINIPANASDEWALGLFELCASWRAQVPEVWLPLGTENWLTSWPATKWLTAKAKAEWPNHWQGYRYQDKLGFSYACKRMAQLHELAQQVEDPAAPQFRWIWETQGSQYDATEIAFERSLWHVAEPGHRLLEDFPGIIDRVQANGYFGSPKHLRKYFGGGDPNDHQALYDACLRSINTRVKTMAGNAATAAKYGCAFDVYEGGDTLIGFQYKSFRDTPEMAALYEHLFSECERIGVDVFFHFADCFPGGKYDWGAVKNWNHSLQATAKGRVIEKWMTGAAAPAPAPSPPAPIPAPPVPPSSPPVDPAPDPPPPVDDHEAPSGEPQEPPPSTDDPQKTPPVDDRAALIGQIRDLLDRLEAA